MKKLIISLFILGLYAVGYAQDITHIQPDFSAFPDGWVSADSSDFGANQHWEKTNLALVQSDADVAQNQWLISPSFGLVDDVDGTLNEDTAYQVTFDYLISANSADAHLYVLLSKDNGVTWPEAADYAAEAIGVYDFTFTGTEQWFSETITVPNDTNTTGKLAFVFYSDAADHGVSLAVDNIQLDSTWTSWTTETEIFAQDFEAAAGIISNSWTTNNVANADEDWDNFYHAAIYEDPDSTQLEWFYSPVINMPDIANTPNYLLDIEFYIKNNGGEGVTLKIKSESDPDWDQHDVSYVGYAANNLFSDQIDLSAFVGEDLQFALVFDATAGNAQDFYLTDFWVHQDFNEAGVNADAQIALGADDHMVFPYPEYYDSDTTDATGIAESFWKVAPNNWTLDTTSNTSWERVSGVWGSNLSHDYAAFIDTVGADLLDLNEVLTSQVFDIEYPAVGGSYQLSFQWRTETNWNAGDNTNPTFIGQPLDFDFADITMEIKVDGGDWMQIWQEDDEEVLEATSVTTGSNYYYGWTGFQDYLDNPNRWYKAMIGLDEYLSSSNTTLQVRFTYTGDAEYAGNFYLDNFYVYQTQNPEFEIEAMIPQTISNNYHLDYYNIPISQVENPVNLGAKVLNYGVNSFENTDLFATVNGVTYGSYEVTSSDWSTYPSTEYLEIESRTNEYADSLTLEVNNGYTVRFDLDINGNTINDQKSFFISERIYNKYNGGITNYLSVDDDSSGAVGSVFEIKRTNKIDYVRFYAGTANSTSQAYMSVIKVDAPDATSGTVVYTSPRQFLNIGWNTFQNDFELEPGLYAFMIHQTDNNTLTIGYNNYFEGAIIRGNANDLYTLEDENYNLYMDIYLIENAAPEITEITNDKLVVAANDTLNNFTLMATDENEDALTWNIENFVVDPAWLGSWIKFTDNGDGTLSVTGKPTDADLGIFNVTVEVSDGFSNPVAYTFEIEVVSDLAYFDPNYTANFRQFVLLEDNLNTGATNSWDKSNTTWADIYGDENEEQEEWLISPPINIPAGDAGVDLSHHLEFDWYINNFNYFCGGIFNKLGTTDTEIGANYADVMVLVSTDNGQNWPDTIWREDDPEILAPITDGIYGGQKWGYTTNIYTSMINLDKYTGEVITFAIVYKSKGVQNENDNYFYAQDFKVLMNDEVDVSAYVHVPFTQIPAQQADWDNGLTFTVQFINHGQTIPEGATYTYSFPSAGYFETLTMDETFFDAGDTVYVDYTFIPDSGEYSTYNFNVTLDLDGNTGNATASNAITIANTRYQQDFASNYAEPTFAQYDGIGTIYEFKKSDELESIWVDFGTNGVPFSISIIKLASPTATEGELIARFDDRYDAYWYSSTAGYTIEPWRDNDYDDDYVFEFEPGYYAIMVNQETANQLYVERSDRDQDGLGFVRGTADALYNESDDKGYVSMYLNMVNNDAPTFTLNALDDETVYQGQPFEKLITTKDVNPYSEIFIETVNLPQWLTFVDNGDGTGVLSGDANNTQPGTYAISLIAHDRFNETPGTFDVVVYPNPPAKFTSTPPSVANEGVDFNYTATGMDPLSEDFVIAAEQSAWLTATPSGNDLVLSGTPDGTDVGNNTIILSITDNSGNVEYQTFDLFVIENAAPEFISSPVLTAVEGLEYMYRIYVKDANEEENLSFSSTLPDWLTLVETTNGKAILSGIPTSTTDNTVEIVVTDEVGNTATQNYTIAIDGNEAPVFVVADTSATEDIAFKLDLTATDADGDYLYFDAEVLPNWMTITVTGNGKATLQGVPTQKYIGNNTVTISVGDGLKKTTANFNVSVALVNDPPIFNSTFVETATANEVYTYNVEAWDEEGANLDFNATLPEWLSIKVTENGFATIQGTPDESNIGVTSVIISVSDGNTSVNQSYDLTVQGTVTVNNSIDQALCIYPNPSSGLFNVSDVAGANIYVYSYTGEIVTVIENAAETATLNLTKNAAGNYLIKIITNNKVITKTINIIK